jgi:hypothetical protein
VNFGFYYIKEAHNSFCARKGYIENIGRILKRKSFIIRLLGKTE